MFLKSSAVDNDSVQDGEAFADVCVFFLVIRHDDALHVRKGTTGQEDRFRTKAPYQGRPSTPSCTI